MAELPQNWIETELVNITNLYTGNSINESVKKEKYTNLSEGFNYIATKDIGYDKSINYKNGIKIPFEETSFKIALKGSVLLCIEGGSAGRKLAFTNEDVCFVNKLCAFVSRISTEHAKFIYYYFQSNDFKAIFNENKNGLIGGVSLNKLKQIKIIQPPLNEQKRIVEKLDKMMRIVDDVNARLNKIPTALKRARQSILNQAITGELTKDWRKKNNIQITKDDLKNKIQTELNFLYRNKKITKENLQIKIDDIRENSCSSWFNIKARFLCHHIAKGTTPKQILEIGAIPYLKVYNIVNNKIDFSYKPQFVSFETHNTFLERSKVYPNDVVMNIVGPPLGKVAIIPNDYKEWNINQALAIFRSIKYLLSEYVYIVLSCDSTLLPVLPDVKGIVGQSNISLEQCRNLLFPLPPIEEQTEIIRRVKLAFEKLDKIESRYQKAKEYSDKLTQSILNKAFRGELVPQDPNDKPISLDDIQVQIAEKPSQKRKTQYLE